MTDHDPTSIEKARAARQRAEDEYARAVGRRPEVKQVAADAYKQRARNGLAELLVLAFAAGKAES